MRKKGRSIPDPFVAPIRFILCQINFKRRSIFLFLSRFSVCLCELAHMKIKELCPSERPREKLIERGAAALSNAELLAVLLRSGLPGESVIELANKLLREADGRLGRLFDLSAPALMRVRGSGPDKASTVLAAFELGKRFLSEGAPVVKKPIVSARMVYELMGPVLKGLDHEECWLLLLNDSNYLSGKLRLTSGGDNATVIDIRQVLRVALERKARSLILVHNHPSANAGPSEADIANTRSLQQAA